MIAGLLKRVFSRGPAKPKIIPYAQHGISRESISACARRVTEALQEHLRSRGRGASSWRE